MRKCDRCAEKTTRELPDVARWNIYLADIIAQSHTGDTIVVHTQEQKETAEQALLRIYQGDKQVEVRVRAAKK